LENITSFTKPEVHNVLQRHQKRVETRPLATCTVRKCGFWDMLAYRQTDLGQTNRYAHCNTPFPFRNKVPITIRRFSFAPPPKIPLAVERSHPVYLPHSSTQPTHHPKRHPDPISRFSTIHQTDRNRQIWHRLCHLY